MKRPIDGPLTTEQIDTFISDGFVCLPGAFSTATAAECVDELWALSGFDRTDPSGWSEPVIRIGGSGHPAIVAAINTPRLVGAIDQLLGPERWERRGGYGTFPIRFPSEVDPGDAGWHIDGSFGEAPNYRVNFGSMGRALLLLMLYTDVGLVDAPTRIRVGSHRAVSRALVKVDTDEGCVFDVGGMAPEALACDVVEAVGKAGDVYLCHPFLVHAASWPHRGSTPRFLSQPAISHAKPDGRFEYERLDGQYSVVERSVREAVEALG